MRRSVVVTGGNPIKADGRFYEIHQKAHGHQIRFSALEHPNVVEGRDVIPGGPTRQWVEDVKAEYGEESAYYRARVLGEFATEGSIDQLISRNRIEHAFRLHEAKALHVAASARRPRIVADIARGGPDQNCMAIVRGAVVEEMTAFSEPNLMHTAKRMHDRALTLGRLDVPRVRPNEDEVFAARCLIRVDDAGVGGGCTDRLRDLRARVIPFIGASTPSDMTRFANRRAEAYFTLRDRLFRGTIALPRDEGLAEELLATCYTLTSAGKIIIEPKEQIRRKIGRSPDGADCISMACEPTREMRIGHLRM